jgi:recombination protein RecT
MANEIATTNKTPVQGFIKDSNVQKMIAERLQARAPQFTTSLLSLVNATPKIAECTPVTVVQAALTAAAMDLPINQNLGFAYIVPYRNKGVMEAQFQMGWKGFIQLAQRSGKFKYLNSTDVREGEMVKRDRLSGAIEFDWIEDEATRNKKKVVGYVSYFELKDGFSSTLYMSVDEIDAHAKRYSQSFKSGFGPWKDNYPAMAKKTVTKLNLSANAPLSTELQTAIDIDQAIIKGENDREYIDGTTDDGNVSEDILDAISSAGSKEDLDEVMNSLSVAQRKTAASFVTARLKQLAA